MSLGIPRSAGAVMVPRSPDSIDVIVPTYREADALPHLIARLATLRADHDLRLLIIDDDSRDGTADLIARLDLPWIHLTIRTEERGLSQSVLAGLRSATADVLVCMDADLSHPPEAIPDMLAALNAGADFVVGSRFCEGGSTDDHWSIFRRLNSRVATLLAR